MKTNRFKYLVAAVMPMMAITGPLYAQQKSETVSTVSLKTSDSEDDNETTKPNAYQLFGHGDPKLDSLGKLMDHYGKLIYNYDHSKAYETLEAKAKGFSKKTPGFYANDTMRHIMAGIDKISVDLNRVMNRAISERRDSLGTLIGDYFKTPAFVNINAKLQAKYHIDPVKNYSVNDAYYQKYHDELMKKLPEGIRNDLQQLRDQSNAYRDQLRSPQYVDDIKQLHLLLDSMKAFIKTKHTEQYTYGSYEATMDVPVAERRKAQNELSDYWKKGELHHLSDKLNDYGTQMRDYYKNGLLVKEHEDAWKNELRTILADNYDVILHPGRDLEHLYSN